MPCCLQLPTSYKRREWLALEASQKSPTDSERAVEKSPTHALTLQDKELLEAKYRKHMAKEKPIAALQDTSSLVDTYSPDLGLALYVDFIVGLASKVQSVQVIYAFYDGATPKTPIKSLPLLPTERVAAGASLLQAVVALKRCFQKVFPSQDVRLVIEVIACPQARVSQRAAPPRCDARLKSPGESARLQKGARSRRCCDS